MRTRPVLHEAENKAKTYEAEATKFGLEAVLASRISIIIIIIIIIINDMSKLIIFCLQH